MQNLSQTSPVTTGKRSGWRCGALLLLAFAAINSAVGAPGRTDPELIRSTAERYVGRLSAGDVKVRATAGRLDERLNLAPCVGELTPSLPAGAAVRAKTLIAVRCTAAGGWTIYVPVAVESDATVLVARRALARGEAPLPADLEAVRRTVPGLPTGFPAAAADLMGRRLRRPLAAGEILAGDLLAPALLVKRGQQVTVVAELSGIAVRASLLAMTDGAAGERIQARNPLSGRVVEGVVQPDGTLAAAP